MTNNNPADVEYAGFWVRVVATIVDTTLVMVITGPVLWETYGEVYFLGDEYFHGGPPLLYGPTDFLLGWVLPAAAVILFWVYKQATPGKMLLKVKIVDAQTGGKPSAGQCIGRYFAYFLSLIPLGLGLIWVAFDKRKQGWHDKLAGTVVIRHRRGHVPVSFDGQN
ncbi:MAG: RDD family protein [Gammaproteobacteria bacterium]|nr:RDD family protein [Gammaproteobacteria bacterium]